MSTPYTLEPKAATRSRFAAAAKGGDKADSEKVTFDVAKKGSAGAAALWV